MLFQNFLNTWCEHEIADSAQPKISLNSHQILFSPCTCTIVRAGSGHETTFHAVFSIGNNRFNHMLVVV